MDEMSNMIAEEKRKAYVKARNDLQKAFDSFQKLDENQRMQLIHEIIPIEVLKVLMERLNMCR